MQQLPSRVVQVRPEAVLRAEVDDEISLAIAIEIAGRYRFEVAACRGIQLVSL